MKKYFSMGFIALTCWGISSCNNADDQDTSDADNSNADTTESVITDTSSTNQTQTVIPADSATVTFITKAASGGMMEVQLGQLAQDQAKNQRVKDFGAMMVRDHGKANDELKMLASAKNVTLPDSIMPEHKRHITHLQNRKGAAFDKAYMNMMAQDHRKDIADFEKASNNLADGEIKAFATRTLPTLKAHMDSITAITKN